MQKFYFLLILLTFTSTIEAQGMTIQTMESLLNKKSITEVNQYFSKTKWSHTKTDEGDAKKELFHYYGYDISYYSGKSTAWLTMFTYDESPQKLMYRIFDKNSFNKIKSAVSKSYRSDGKLDDYLGTIYSYINNKFKIDFLIDVDQTEYVIIIYKREGYYDPENGYKEIYFDDGTLQQTAHLIDGKLNGIRELYNQNGKLKFTGNYKDGKEHGKGTFYIYDEDKWEVIAKHIGEFKNGERHGEFETYYLIDNDFKNVDYFTYENGIKNGPFMECRSDSIIFGNYKNDLLDGNYNVYLDFKVQLFGGIPETDTTKLFLIEKGTYSNGKKTGLWWYDDFNLIFEGKYDNDKKTGVWNYWFRDLEDDLGNSFPYSNQLFLTRTYKNDEFEGLSMRFWGEKNEDPHYANQSVSNSEEATDELANDTYIKLRETAYFKDDQLDGLYELLDGEGNIITKGYYINNLKDGLWVEYENPSPAISHEFKSKGNYNEGVKNGEWRVQESLNLSDVQMSVIYEGNYIDDMKNGEWKVFNGDGILMETRNYKNNELNGENIFWYNNEQPKRVKVFKDGKIIKSSEFAKNNPDQPFEIYDILKITEEEIFYIKTLNSDNSKTTQEFIVKSEKYGAFESYVQESLLNQIIIDPWIGSKGYKHGVYKQFDNNDNLIEYGEYFKDKKIRTWIKYYNEQKVQVVVEYESEKPSIEKYFILNSTNPYTGKFVFINEERNIKEVRKIKKGLRHGKTNFYYSTTGEFIRFEKYKHGALR